MRFKEFVSEAKKGKISQRDSDAAHAIDIYSDTPSPHNTDNMSYRLGLAVACTDGKNLPDMDKESWIGKRKTVHPYTSVEQDMLKLAYKVVGASHKTVAHPGSKELPDVHSQSPVASFKKKTK